MLWYLRRWLTENRLLKLFSLVLACLLWLWIASDISSDVTRTVDLEWQSTPTNMVITDRSTTVVQVTLRGSSSQISEMSDADIRAIISVAGQSPGPITAQPNIQTPFGVEVLSSEPRTVDFRLQEMWRRTLPVEPNVEGDPAAGFVRENTFITPSTVDVQGPRSAIEPLESLTTTAVRIDGARADVRQFVDLNLLDPAIQLPTLVRPEVFVQISEETVEAAYTFTFDAVLAEAGWGVDPASVEVTLNGPRSVMADLDPETLYFTFETEDLDPDIGEVAPELGGYDELIAVVAIEPETVQIAERPD